MSLSIKILMEWCSDNHQVTNEPQVVMMIVTVGCCQTSDCRDIQPSIRNFNVFSISNELPMLHADLGAGPGQGVICTYRLTPGPGCSKNVANYYICE